MENHLLSVRQELGVPCEVPLLHPSSWDEGQGDQGWQEEDVGVWEQGPGGPHGYDSEVGIAPLKSPIGLLGLVEENAIFMCLNAIEVGMVIHYWGWSLGVSEHKSHELEHEAVLEDSLGTEPVVGGVFLSLIVHKLVAEPINWEPSVHPSEEIIILYVFIWDLVFIVVIRWHLDSCIRRFRVIFLVIMWRTSSTESSLALIKDLRFFEIKAMETYLLMLSSR